VRVAGWAARFTVTGGTVRKQQACSQAPERQTCDRLTSAPGTPNPHGCQWAWCDSVMCPVWVTTVAKPGLPLWHTLTCSYVSNVHLQYKQPLALLRATTTHHQQRRAHTLMLLPGRIHVSVLLAQRCVSFPHGNHVRQGVQDEPHHTSALSAAIGPPPTPHPGKTGA
jgi:hypothetical protein